MKWWILPILLLVGCDNEAAVEKPLAPTAKPRSRVTKPPVTEQTAKKDAANPGPDNSKPAGGASDAGAAQGASPDAAKTPATNAGQSTPTGPDVGAQKADGEHSPRGWRRSLEVNTSFDVSESDQGVLGAIWVYGRRLTFSTTRVNVEGSGDVNIIAQLFASDGACLVRLEDGEPSDDFLQRIVLPRSDFLDAHLATQLREHLQRQADALDAPRDYQRLLRLVQFYGAAVVDKAIDKQTGRAPASL